jgi:hypothetical protein
MAWMEPCTGPFEDSWTTLYPNAKFDEDPLDIMNELNEILLGEHFYAVPQPTPIGCMGEVAIVQELSARDDYHLYNRQIANVAVALLSEESHVKKRPHPDAANSNSNGNSVSSPHTKKQKTTVSDQNNQSTKNDFHKYQSEKWDSRFQDLVQFKQTYGHCTVPNMFSSNPKLAQWVKRQRYQHKLKAQGKPNTLTYARRQVLEMVGFAWDSHEAAWMERWNELRSYRVEHGHNNVPTNYESTRHLWIWVKCQRRQYRLFQSGQPSNMTMERIIKMESLNFNWNPRNLKL